MKNMKYYLIAFSLVFSLLTSSWSGATVQIQESASEPCAEMGMVAHDCCNETMMQDACAACDGECHCDGSVSHANFGLLLITHASLVPDTYLLVINATSQFPAEPFQRKFLPPKI